MTTADQPTGPQPCAHCLWGIYPDRGWRLGIDADEPWTCEGHAEGHQPGRLETGRMVPLSEPETATETTP